MNNLLAHLSERGLDLSKYNSIIVDGEDNCVTFLLHNLLGQLVGYQRYRPDGDKKARENARMKYYTYVGDSHRNTAYFWGLETLRDNLDYTYLVEGVFDAVKLHNEGEPCLAVLSCDGNKGVRAWRSLFNKEIIAVLDNDDNDSGEKLKRCANQFIRLPAQYGDLGDMTQEEVHKWLLAQ